MSNYRYELMKGSRKFICPNCQKKTFVPYVKAEDGKTIVDSTRFGRCERINSCSYIQYPNIDDGTVWTPPQRIYEPPKEPDYIPKELVEKTFNNFKQNPFSMYLVKLFGIDTTYELQEKYNIGTAKGYGTTFAQQDKEGNYRTVKVFYYDKTGHRRKDKPSWYIHNKIKPDYNLQQVFFGEHLLKNNDKPVALVESEKSAVILSQFYPEYTWLASGGAEMLNIYRLGRLPRLDYVFPDNGQFQKWKNKTQHFTGRHMDFRVDDAVNRGILDAGADLLDLELIERKLDKIAV